MQIGIFTTDFPYKEPFRAETFDMPKIPWGGVAEVTYQLALVLNKRGHKIKIFTTSLTHSDEIQVYENITVYRYKMDFMIENTPISLGLLMNPLKHNIDVALIQRGSPPGAIAGYLYAKYKKRPYILSYHGHPTTEHGSIIKKIVMMGFNKLFLNQILNDANMITVLSHQFLKEPQAKLLENYLNNIRIVPNGINIFEHDIPYSKEECRKRLNLPSDKKIILFVGSLTPRKAPHILLRAMMEVVSTIPNSFLVLVGDGTMREELKKEAEALNLTNFVRFAGFVSEEEKKEYYRSADIFVLPSFSEGFPMVLLEASLYGIPLVVSDLDAFNAIVRDSINGEITKAGEYKDLSDTIIHLLGNEKKRRKMQRNAFNIVRKYDWELIGETFEKLLSLIALIQ